jgi:hypothetical protein
MKLITRAAATCVAIFLATAGWTQSRLELAETYNALPAVQEMMVAMFSPEASAAQFRASLPPGVPISDDKALRVGEIMSGVLMGLKPTMETLQTEAIAEVFTEEEIQAMIDFHSTEIGAQVLVKTQPMFQRVMGELTPQIMQAMAAKQAEIIEIMSEEN